MPQRDLSPEQARVLEPDVRVVEAGPGSGKTRALVARFLQSASSTRRGVALVSFTNAAVDEVRRRAGNAPHVLRAPHFVGTIDSFLHRFIVTPAEVARLGRLPCYRPSWEELPSDITILRIGGVPGVGLPLSAFRMDQPGSVILHESGLDWRETQYLNDVDGAGRRSELINRARALMLGLNRSGVYDANTARVRAFEILNGPAGQVVVDRITTRFVELLVDEAQDCDEAEMGVIRRLATGLRVIIVADPDQAIFEFRGSDPALFSAYRDEQDLAGRVQLSTNYRSSNSICRTVATLRAAGAAAIHASDLGPCPTVLVLDGTAAEQREKFLAALDEHGIPRDQAIVLAHSRSDAAAVAGVIQAQGNSAAAGNRLAAACAVLRRPDASPAQRLEAIERIERLILSLIAWPDNDIRAAGRERQLDLLGRRSDWLRRAAGTFVSRLGPASDRDAFGTMSRQVLGQILDGLPVGHAALGDKVKKPDEVVWSRCVHAAEALPALPCSTVHAAKGSEFTAVLVALPSTLRKVDDRDLLDDWADGRNTEPRRVLYVAASRAQRLLAFGAGPHLERIALLLEDNGVAMTRV